VIGERQMEIKSINIKDAKDVWSYLWERKHPFAVRKGKPAKFIQKMRGFKIWNTQKNEGADK
jgi:hypothetical protein